MNNFLYFYQHIPFYLNSKAFSVGGFSLNWYSLAYLTGFVTVYWLLKYRIKKGEFNFQEANFLTGITLDGDNDEVVGMISIDNPETTVLVVSEKGYGKRTDIDDYRVTNRGGKGVKTLNVTDKTGELVAIKGVTDKEDLMIINKSGIIIRIAVSELRTMGRATQGVRLITLKGDDEIASVAKIEHDEEEEAENAVEGSDIQNNAGEGTAENNENPGEATE